LSDILINGDLRLIVEGKYSSGLEDIKFVWKFENNYFEIDDKVNAHLINLDFIEAQPVLTGYDDNNSDELGDKLQASLMIPLDYNGTGSNTVRVLVSPPSLYPNIELAVVDQSIANVAKNLSSGDVDLNIDGVDEGSTELIAKCINEFGSTIAVAESMWVDPVLPMPQLQGQKINIAIYNIQQTGEIMPSGYNSSTLENYLNNITWGVQGNIHFNFLSDSINVENVNYDINSPIGLRRLDGSEYTKIISAAHDYSADINIYVVELMEESGKYGFYKNSLGRHLIFVADLLNESVIAHEIGHALGINDDLGEGHSKDGYDVMSGWDSIYPVEQRIRRYDWFYSHLYKKF